MTLKERDVTVGELPRAPVDSPAGSLLPVSCDAIGMERIPPRSVINLRGRPEDRGFVAAIKQAIHVELPVEPNTWTGDDGSRAAIWLGPDEWLVLAADGEAASLEADMRAALPGYDWLSVVDLSQNYTALRLSGSCARELLAKGCPLDLHAQAFAAGRCAQTTLARTGVLLRVVDDAALEAWFRNSFADYTVRWLSDAAAEFLDQ